MDSLLLIEQHASTLEELLDSLLATDSDDPRVTALCDRLTRLAAKCNHPKVLIAAVAAGKREAIAPLRMKLRIELNKYRRAVSEIQEWHRFESPKVLRATWWILLSYTPVSRMNVWKERLTSSLYDDWFRSPVIRFPIAAVCR